MNLIELFAGLGNASRAAESLGWETVGFVGIDKFRQKQLKDEFGDVPIVEDIKNVSRKSFRWANVITAGFPCQDNSQANTNGKGLDGSRSGLWTEAVRVIDLYKPDWAVLENVANYVRVDIDRLCGELENKGYETQTFDFRACCVGLPTLERHIWIVAANKEKRREEMPETISSQFVKEKPVLRSDSGIRCRRAISESRFLSVGERVSVATTTDERKMIQAIGDSFPAQMIYQIFKTINQVKDQYDFNSK